MVELLLAGDGKRLSKPGVVLKIYDPCAGFGGTLAAVELIPIEALLVQLLVESRPPHKSMPGVPARRPDRKERHRWV